MLKGFNSSGFSLKSLVTVLFVAVSVASFAQQGTISGVVSEENGNPIPFLNVSILGTTIGAATDFDGKYSISAEPGTYQLLFSFVGYKNDTISNVTVTAGGTTALNHKMGGSSINIKEFEVEAERNMERETILLLERKESTDLKQAIGAVKLQEKGATDAADGVKKVVGLSVVGGRYVFVRGLGDRYNSAYLNGMPLPSPDPDSKVAPMDIFPTNVVRTISVNKAFTPSLYGDFSGGAIDIATKTALKEPQLKVSFGAGINSVSTFKAGKGYNGGGNDFWGMDDGTRELPAILETSDPFGGDRILPFRRNFNSIDQTVRPDMNFGLFGGTSFDLGENSKLNLLLTANYRNSSRYVTGKNRIVNSQNVALIDYTVESYNFNTQSSGLGTINLELGKNHDITFNSLLVNLSSDQHRENYGEHFDYEQDVYARRFTFRENRVFVNQLLGEHGFGIDDRLKVNWSVSTSKAKSTEPDRRQLVYLFDPNTGVYNFNSIDRVENHRWFSDLNEEELAFGASAEYRIKEKEIEGKHHSLMSVVLGAQAKRKDRDFDYDIYAYRLEDLVSINPNGVNVDRPDQYLDQQSYASSLFFVQDVTGIESLHFIRQDINAFYGSLNFDVIPQRFRILTGARLEDGTQRVIYRNNFDSEIDPYRVANNNSVEILPYLSMKFDLDKKNIIRASASKTISRPGFREMAPFEYTEFFAGTKNVGNPELLNGTNYNADIRFERYPTPGELFAVGLFGKLLQDPIEKVAVASASGQLQTFRNTGQGTVFGLEIEYIKNVGNILGLDSTCWNNLSVGINATVLASEIDLTDEVGDDGAAQVGTNLVRPLQGASPYLVNFDLSYTKTFSENFKGVATLAYNVYGKRVFAAGVNGLGDQYEMPLNTVNLILRGEIGEKWGVNLKGSNLLNAEYRIEQETPNGNAVINSFRTGVNMSFGLSYRLF